MFNIGDVIVYSAHGLCQIDDICEKTVANVTRTYYVLHPLEGSSLTISTPVDNDRIIMLMELDEKEATNILKSFKQPGVPWISDVKQRNTTYHGMIKAGNREEIAKVANTLMRKNMELIKKKKKRLYDQDRKLLNTIQSILFKELADALHTTVEEIAEKANHMIEGFEDIDKQNKALVQTECSILNN
nr:CarD family transcriptional regulator [uncultured Bacillus sp.]